MTNDKKNGWKGNQNDCLPLCYTDQKFDLILPVNKGCVTFYIPLDRINGNSIFKLSYLYALNHFLTTESLKKKLKTGSNNWSAVEVSITRAKK